MSIPWTAPTSEYLEDQVGAKPVTAKLVRAEELKAPEVYKRFLNQDRKAAFRVRLIETIRQGTSAEIAEKFLRLAENLDEDGAVVLAAILDSPDFQKLINEYTRVMDTSGSQSWLHSYVNMANHPEFLANRDFNAAFIHPLIIALVSYRIGGPVRVVDARGKDAAPISVLAQDNMLHIDNTPFNDEYKLLLTWERGKPSGPKGQNFVFLPGTHKGVRQCMVTDEGTPWSSENASIFITADSIEELMRFQEQTYGKRAVVELTNDTKPLSTLFAAGSLVHHRHRTASGFARSCMILAFHRADDNPGQLVDGKHLPSSVKTDELAQLLFSTHGRGSEDRFLKALSKRMSDMKSMFERIDSMNIPTEVIAPTSRELSASDVAAWKEACTDAPTVESKKKEAYVVPLGQSMPRKEFIVRVGRMMTFDKHGPLDLILYPDAHEEIRKWARNRIREKQPEDLMLQLQEHWGNIIVQPQEADLLTPVQLQQIAYRLADMDVIFQPSEGETISATDATLSVKQLLRDLGEAIVRCENPTAFLSSSLFIFWATDMLASSSENPEIKELGSQLLQSYLATALLVAEHQKI